MGLGAGLVRAPRGIEKIRELQRRQHPVQSTPALAGGDSQLEPPAPQGFQGRQRPREQGGPGALRGSVVAGVGCRQLLPVTLLQLRKQLRHSLGQAQANDFTHGSGLRHRQLQLGGGGLHRCHYALDGIA